MGKMLVADDNDLFRKTIRRIHGEAGHSVEEASDGQSVLQLLGRTAFDIVLLDIVMPGKGGIETLLELNVSNKDVRVIVMTGRIDTGTTAFQTLCRRFKTEKILTKPFTSKQLLDSVNELLPRKN